MDGTRSLGVAVVGGIVLTLVNYFLHQEGMPYRGKARSLLMTTYSIGILLWPLIWKALLEDKTKEKVALISLIWPIVLLSTEIYLLRYHSLEELLRQRKLLSMDANALCTLMFALCGILGAHKDTCCKNIFIYGVLGCVAFVMPNLQMPSLTLENVALESIQKICLNYSIGLLLAGSLLMMKKNGAIGKESD